MADITGKVKALINSVRGSMTGHKGQPGGQADGYRQYRREREAMGEPVQSYEEWAKTAPALDSKVF